MIIILQTLRTPCCAFDQHLLPLLLQMQIPDTIHVRHNEAAVISDVGERSFTASGGLAAAHLPGCPRMLS